MRVTILVHAALEKTTLSAQIGATIQANSHEFKRLVFQRIGEIKPHFLR